MVLWLIGISGAGKTTLAEMLKRYYTGKGTPVYILDGDIVRSFYENDLGYTKEDRQANIKRIMLAAHVLDENNIVTIVANISPFERLRQFARRKIKNYNQIYLHKNLSVSVADDVKSMYKNNLQKSAVVGIDMPFEEPMSNELVIEVDQMTKEESFSRIIQFVYEKYGV